LLNQKLQSLGRGKSFFPASVIHWTLNTVIKLEELSRWEKYAFRRELTVKNITKPFFEINDYRQVFSAMNDVKQTTQIEGCFKYFSLKAKLGIEERKFALLQFAFRLFLTFA